MNAVDFATVLIVLSLQCFGGIASEADNLLNEIQYSLAKQEERLANFADKQREVCIRIWNHLQFS
jgi:hypothetical protein